jgi:choline/glycine/proline betaine transport protein
MKQESTINPPVFFTSAGLLVLLLGFSVSFPKRASLFFETIQNSILNHFSWFYILSTVIFFLFALWIVRSPFGSIRLGADDEKPVYSRFSWYAMLFAAGMGIGLVFYGVAEPMRHFMSPPFAEGLSPEAHERALSLTFHHWGLHAWAIYAVIGLCIAYFAHRHNHPLTLRSCFYPVLGERIHGWMGHTIDIIAVFGTLFGLATSLGVGATSVSAGLHKVVGTPDTTTVQLIIIAVITLAATVSLVTGVDKGIKRLSEVNLVIASILLIFVFAVGPTTSILNHFVESTGMYFQDFIHRSFHMGVGNPKEHEWIKAWSVVYWGWWIAWAPFVGVFVAKISRGRTIKDFVLSVMCVPVAVTFVWFSVFGGGALDQGVALAEIMKAQTYDQANAIAVYAFLETLPFALILKGLAVIVVTIFFVSSSDSASYVVDLLTSGGNEEPPTWQRIFWASAEGLTAGILLYAGGTEVLKGLKAGVVSFGLPFCALILVMIYSLVKKLKEEELESQNLESQNLETESTESIENTSSDA